MKQPYNTALYYRLSRDDENFGDSVSIETQRTILQQFARDNQFHVVDEYIDATDMRVFNNYNTCTKLDCCLNYVQVFLYLATWL